MTSGLNLLLLCRMSYEVGKRKSGTILGGELRRREGNMNVVPRSTKVLHSTLIYTSELILYSITVCVHSATRPNIHMYPYLLFAVVHHLKENGRREPNF